MADLSTTYLGIPLKNPVIVASSQLTRTVDKVVECAQAGAGAVVLKSMFEEQILADVEADMEGAEVGSHSEAQDFFSRMGRDVHMNDYLALIKECKGRVGVPVIASVNCVTSGSWTEYAQSVEAAGADALELNVFLMPAEVGRSAREIETVYLEIARKIKRRLSIPVAMKLGLHFSALATMIRDLQLEGINGFVLFNRFYRPDVDIEKLQIKAGSVMSTPEEIGLSLQWIALLSGEIEADFAATTGIHDAEGAIKQLLVGARAVQLCSTLYLNGLERISQITEGIRQWMDRRGFGRISDFNGLLCQERSENPAAYERTQYIKALVGIS